MKDLTKSELGACIKKYVFGNSKYGKNKYDIKTLFKLYSLHEIENLENIIYNWNDFCSFVLSNKKKIYDSMPSPKISFKGLTQRKKQVFENQFDEELTALKADVVFFDNVINRGARKIFSGIVGDIISGNNMTILDVGSGPIPDTSFEIAKKAKKTYAMDEFIVALDFIRNRGVEPLEEMFTSKTNTGNYDMIVGKSACSAIRPIVEVCSKTNTPYFLELCGCDLENQRYRGQLVDSWDDILPCIDKNVKFYKKFAYNLDISEKQIDALFEKNIKKTMEEQDLLDGEMPQESAFLEFIDIAAKLFVDSFVGYLDELENRRD